MTAAKDAPSAHHPARARPLVVELVGAAGAGKSTLVAELRRRDASVRWLQRARQGDARADVARQAVGFAPAWLAAASRSPRYAWDNARFFLRLAALEPVVRRAAAAGPGTVILEHGPVFTLARLRAFEDAPMPAPLRRYAARRVARWARILDLVIALDAPLDVLAERIHSRDKDHAMRGRDEEQLRHFVDRYRAAFAGVLADLAAAGGPPVLTLRSDQLPVEAMADRVERAFEERQGAR
jgi:predicted ATPase